MEKLVFVLMFGLLVLMMFGAKGEGRLEKGQSAPVFSANTLAGDTFDLAAASKKAPVVLVFLRGFS